MFRARTLIKLCVVLLIVHSVSCQWLPDNIGKETLCKTAECKARGNEYKKNLNSNGHPCQDFYAFTCGNWQKNHPGPKYASEWSINNVIEIDFFTIIRKILESYNFQQGDDVKFIQAKQIYESCIKIPEYPIQSARNIAQEITRIGRIATTPLWSIHSKYLLLSGTSAFFRTKIMWSSATSELPLLMVLEPESAFGSVYHGDFWKPQEKEAYTDFLFRIMKSLKFKDSDKMIRERVERVFQFRLKLHRIIRQNKNKYPDDFTVFTGQGLDNLFSQTFPQMTTTQKLRWKEVIDVLLKHVPADKRQTRGIITMRQKQYFVDLLNLFKNTFEEVLASHIEIYFVESHLTLDERMYKLLEKTSIEPHSLKTYIRDKYYPRWYTCIEELNMKNTIEKLLYQKWFPKNYVDNIRAMNGRVKLAIEGQMENSYWLDKPTREETAKRIQNSQAWIGFPPWVIGNGPPPIGRNQDQIFRAQVLYTYDSNALYVQAPYLLPPMFSPTIPVLYNFAGIGASLGHELYHVIDDCGQYDLKTGKVTWWELPMRKECLRIKESFIDGYNKITDREFKNRYKIVLTSDTSSSVLENLPDVMGLQAAYNAYKKLALKDTSACQTLNNFEFYSCDQMFYIAFANTFCGYYTKKAAHSRITEKSTHSLDSIRVNGAVAQMKSFGTAFGCPVGSPMNPRMKMNLWK